MIKILELFGGIGAPRKALINLGVDHKSIDYVEIDERRVRVYNAMYDNRYKAESVVGYNLKPDILIHGSPCQDFSRARLRWGARDGGEGEQSSLLSETVKIIKNMGSWKPSVVIWENVKGVLDRDMIGAFNEYIESLEELGYKTSFDVLNAMDFGIPQARERVFAISRLDGVAFDFGKLRRRETPHIDNFLEEKVTDEKYFINIPSMTSKIREINPEGVAGYSRMLDVIDTHCWTITERQDRCPNAGIIRTGTKQYRYLTEREVWRLMGFDDEDFDAALKEFPGREGFRNATLYAMAGNSIVVNVLEAIFDVLLNGNSETDFISNKDGQLKLIC
ncbi:DNA (cytosine-5-)-methyltransferase [Siminovitchia fortis]|uniref:Cytosine-specific methyltransferase n=1 Tax=Siminovitchia fortis TaxID=254758 RepID=A0A443IMV3_9BACI|nr:DNA (cytosine-5-)-methyltransferase [Siminovitchia fortis]RWR06731.1 DNA (cytosine-5-)-methyltransferase [Siminovitchia fortis]WHY82999.1 DNA (cytosine-5-)-methyltransferase [Siminovitchia fortis]